MGGSRGGRGEHMKVERQHHVRRMTNNAGRVQNSSRTGWPGSDMPSEFTGGKPAVSGAEGCHFRRRFHRSLYATCNAPRHCSTAAFYISARHRDRRDSKWLKYLLTRVMGGRGIMYLDFSSRFPPRIVCRFEFTKCEVHR